MKEDNFENKIKQLEEIVNTLEKGELSLEESVKKFEQGIEVSKQCNELLQNAERRITLILNNNGKISEENFLIEE